MMQIDRIVVPSVFSESSRGAVGYALGLARTYAARIDLIHFYRLPERYVAPYGMMIVRHEVLASFRDAAARKLHKTLEAVTAEGIEAEMHLAEGEAGGGIADCAARNGADLVVMGTRGLSGLKHLLLGSVAQRTVEEAPCPVMTVGRESEASGALRFRKIIVPTDFSPSSQQALTIATQLAKTAGPAELVVVHSYFVPRSIQACAGRLSEPRFGKRSTRLLEALESVVKVLGNEGIPASYELNAGDPERVILEIAETHEADLIVMGTRGRTGLPHALLGSVAERVLRAAPCPTITVKNSA